jgi:hypothetical protein
MAQISWNGNEAGDRTYNVYGHVWNTKETVETNDLWLIEQCRKDPEFTVTGAPTTSPGVNAIVPQTPHVEIKEEPHAEPRHKEVAHKEEPKHHNKDKNETRRTR